MNSDYLLLSLLQHICISSLENPQLKKINFKIEKVVENLSVSLRNSLNGTVVNLTCQSINGTIVNLTCQSINGALL